MTTTTETGGPAFPTTKPLEHWGDPNQGMTLRDYFAGKAMQAQLSAQWEYHYKTPSDEDFSNQWDFIDVALCAYDIADAMLEARK
jgi:hypothetical protein